MARHAASCSSVAAWPTTQHARRARDTATLRRCGSSRNPSRPSARTAETTTTSSSRPWNASTVATSTRGGTRAAMRSICARYGVMTPIARWASSSLVATRMAILASAATASASSAFAYDDAPADRVVPATSWNANGDRSVATTASTLRCAGQPPSKSRRAASRRSVSSSSDDDDDDDVDDAAAAAWAGANGSEDDLFVSRDARASSARLGGAPTTVVVPLTSDFSDEVILSRAARERYEREGWDFDEFDGDYEFEDVVDALLEFKRRYGDFDVPPMYVAGDAVVEEDDLDDADEEDDDEAAAGDLDAALAALLGTPPPGAASATPGSPDAEPSIEELLALEAETTHADDGTPRIQLSERDEELRMLLDDVLGPPRRDDDDDDGRRGATTSPQAAPSGTPQLSSAAAAASSS
mmetsp:Transcript_14426/g.57484  ORF Transcript_14426/g.57484 Transcript_14426/m.57484 type:complete len:411 (+) Transcript_14426:930-2162(+)